MKKNSRKATSNKHSGPGRPKYEPVFPRTKEWTFTDFMEVNGIDTNPGHKDFGKGPNCTMLTLRKFMARDAKKLGRSLIFKVRGVTSEPNSKDGLGRRAYLYSLRAKANVKRGSAPKDTAPAEVTPHDDVSDATKRYEELKSILAAPAPAVTIPAVTITPEATQLPVAPVVPVAPAPEPAPVAETAPAVEAAPATPEVAAA